MRTRLLLYVVVGCGAAELIHLFDKAVSQPPPKEDWFVVDWKASPSSERRGATATVRYHENIYKLQCWGLMIVYFSESVVPADKRMRGLQPCSTLAEYVGKSIPRHSEGWFLKFRSPIGGGLQLEKTPDATNEQKLEYLEVYTVIEKYKR
jgi:hypothetical protein